MPMHTPEQFRARKALAEFLQTSPRRAHDLIRTQIREGLLQPNDRLVEDFLIHELATSRNAVREALQLLASEGLVRRERREGTTVVGSVIRIPVDDILSAATSGHFRVERVDDRKVPSTDLIRTRLRTDAAEVGVIEHLFTFDEQPIGIRVAYYQAHIRQPIAWEQCPDMSTAFEAVFGLPMSHVDTTIDAVPCEARTSRVLGIPEGSPCLVKEQILYDVTGRPQEFAYSHYRSDRVSFVARASGGTVDRSEPVGYQAARWEDAA
jgi:GntR family transcriptional regulator